MVTLVLYSFSITALLGEYFDPRNLSVFFSPTEIVRVIRSKKCMLYESEGVQVGNNLSYVIIL